MTCWESGFTWNPVSETERMHDYNLYAMFSSWDVLKNVDGQYPNHKLNRAAYIAGKHPRQRIQSRPLPPNSFSP